jgi:hypothetical protein
MQIQRGRIAILISEMRLRNPIFDLFGVVID